MSTTDNVGGTGDSLGNKAPKSGLPMRWQSPEALTQCPPGCVHRAAHAHTHTCRRLKRNHGVFTSVRTLRS